MIFQLWMLAVALLVFAMFGVREIISGRHTSARVHKQGASPFLGDLPMEFYYWLLSPVGRLASYFEVSPNFFSWTCLLIGFASGIAAGFGSISLAGGLSLLSALFDSLDGMVARNRGIASDAGEVLDAAVDRYTEFFLLAGFCVYYRHTAWALALVLGALIGSMLVSYSQAKAEAMQADIPKGWMRRPERALYLGGGAFLSPLITVWFEAGETAPLHYPLLFAILLVAVFANATAIRRFFALYNRLAQKNSR